MKYKFSFHLHEISINISKSALIVCTSLLLGCGSSDENLPPEITFTMDSYEGSELSQITIEADVTDVDGVVMLYDWKQISGSLAIFSNQQSNTLELSLPDVTSDEELLFSLAATDNDGAVTTKEFNILVKSSLADKNIIFNYQVSENDNNSSVFISSLDIQLDPTLLSGISFSVTPKQHSAAEPFQVNYSLTNLSQTASSLVIPVYGLYSNYSNTVNLTFIFTDGSRGELSPEILTGLYVDNERNVYDNVEVVKGADSLNKPSYSYFLLKSAVSGPIIMDIDGNVRWISSELYDASNSTYINGTFYVALGNLMITHDLSDNKSQLEFSQGVEFSSLSNVDSHHNVDRGKSGVLVEIDADKGGVRRLESILWETDLVGNVIAQWDFGDIVENYMLDFGDDPSSFVRHGIDWCHMNAATYDSSDDSILVSCREDFVIKIDYSSKEIQWLLGDETKYWYTFPSLAALSLSSLDTKPIGQHALSISNNDLLLFNNGFFSLNSPEGESKGISLETSRASRYSIDVENNKANLVWEYDPGLYSDVCSSVYRDPKIDGDYLVNFAAINRTNGQTKKVILQGVSENKELLFEFHLLSPERPCITAWNAEPLFDLTNLSVN